MTVSSDSMSLDSSVKVHLDRLREEREKAGISQRELARRCGLSPTQVYRYEIGDNEPSAVVLGNMARELGVTTDYLLGLSDSPHGYSSGDLNTDERKLLDAFSAGDSIKMLTLITERLQKLADGGDAAS